MSGESLWQPSLKLTLKINVVLLGLNVDHTGDGDQLVLQARSLERTLEETLPSHSTYAVPAARLSLSERVEYTFEGHRQQRSPSSLFQVQYDMSYAVKHASKESHDEYLETLARAGEVDGDGDPPTILIPIDAITQAVETMALKESDMAKPSAGPPFGNTEVTILVANPDRVGLSSRLESLGKKTRGSGADAGREEWQYSFVEPGSLHQVQQGMEAAAGKRSSSGDSKVRRSICARSWVGKGRVLVLDLGAMGCGYGALREVTDSLGKVTDDLFPRGTANGNSWYWLQRLEELPGLERTVSTSWRGASATNPANVFSLKLSSLVVSAVRTVFVPAVPTAPRPGTASEVIIVPLLVFRGNKAGDRGPASEDSVQLDGSFGLDDVVDVAQISKVVNAMAPPQQEVVVIGAAHSFSEHPQVAVALEKSLATKARLLSHGDRNDIHSNFEVLQEGYVDSGKLLLEMKSAGDTLVSSLLSDSGADHVLRLGVALAAESKAQEIPRLDGSAGVRVLPVFVFCLGDADETLSTAPTSSTSEERGLRLRKERPARLFEGSSPFAADVGGDAVLVLQSDGSAPIPFYERSETLRLPLSDATQAVVAGLLKSVHGISAPHHSWSSAQQAAAVDLSWAHGYHPFAPFGFGGSEPGELLADIARRDAVASRASVVAATLVEAAAVLEDAAEAVVPTQLLVTRAKTELSQDGAATKGEWGRHFESSVASEGLPANLVDTVVAVHRKLYDAVGTFEEELTKARGMKLTDVITSMEKAQGEASSALAHATTAAKELGWCKCATSRVSNASHVPWLLYLGLLSVVLCGLGSLAAAARRALINYVGASGTGSGARW